MLEITGDDIAALNDENLRSLVGRLCESELRCHGLATSAVTWGGKQDAADGGIDVRVRINDGAAPGGFIPKTIAGFQVKRTDFTRALIGREMRPTGQLRGSIKDLIDECGAYIIVSSGSNTSDSALINRVTAMRAAVADELGHEHLQLDFYDRNRIATWTRGHPGLAVWVRHKIGRSIPGWRPHSSWGVSPDGLEDEYLLDNKARLHVGIADEKGLDVRIGIDRVRNTLRGLRGIVRLAGLSGVGKTRLVEALFDQRIGYEPLDPGFVVYTDMNDNPSPQPTAMISDLIASRTRAIVVVDNCAPDLHRRVTELCRRPDSLISAITVEYDVQEDEPEGTEVFRLDPSSPDLISKLLARRFPAMTQLSVDRIAEFSGGNARLALALANNLEHGESVAGLQDEELFRRLFHQRQVQDDSLLKAAQACALLYSFQGEAIASDDAELPTIAALVGMSATDLFAKVAELMRRDLVQRRSVWRAVLPHAVANRLAKWALRVIPLELIEQRLDTERLMKSFSRRLGYLHESDEAKGIAERWLAKGGLLDNVARLTQLGVAMFSNIAPVAPEAALAAIERAFSGPNAREIIDNQSRRSSISTVLRSIAYDASLFDRCVTAMVPLAMVERIDQSHPTRRALEELFHVIYSGTHAAVEQRTTVAHDLLKSNERDKRSLGLQLVDALLKADHFLPTHSFEFGARVRDYGYWPTTREERVHWFVTTLQMARQFASPKDEIGRAIRSKIAQSMLHLWFLGPEVQDQFETVANDIAANGYWQEGWLAIRWLLGHPSEGANAIAVERLRTFERRVYPKNVVEQVRAIVLSQRWGVLDFAELNGGDIDITNPTAAQENADAIAEELGKAVCVDQTAFAAVLPDLVSGYAARLFAFGRGLATATVDHRSTWLQLTQALNKTEEETRNVGAIGGFLNGLSGIDQQHCEVLLEEAVEHETLGVWFPALQSSVTISATGAHRLNRAVTLGRAKPGDFYFLGHRSDVSNHDLRTILLSLATRENGFGIATDILTARFHQEKHQKKEHPSELIDAGRELLASPDFSVRDNTHDYDLQTVASVCLCGPEGSGAALSLCKRMKQAITDDSVRAYNYEQTLHCVFELQPRIALEVFFGGTPQSDSSDLDFDDFSFRLDSRRNPLDGISVDEVLQWCDEKATERYPAMSRLVSYHTMSEDGWAEWSPVAMEMLKQAPDPSAVLEIFVRRFLPRSWSGSRATIIESRLTLLDRLSGLKNQSLEDYATRIRPELENTVTRERESENERDSARDERFE